MALTTMHCLEDPGEAPERKMMIMKKKRRVERVCNSDCYHISKSDIDIIGFDDANPTGADMEVNHHVEEEDCLEGKR